MIKYLGSKRLLIPRILELVHALGPEVRTVADLFSGTSRVGHALKRGGYRVLANDHNAYAHRLAMCYVQADREDVLADAMKLVAEFNSLSGSAGYVTETFCTKSRYFQPKNGERIDAIREAIARKGLSPELESVMLVSLIEAADRVDSTTGVQMAYLKQWAPRAHNDLELRVPDVLVRSRNGACEAHAMDATEAAATLPCDVAYIDPPYNQHSYLGNYHVWESIVRWDKPEVYGVACKRVDVRDRRSPFNSRTRFADAMRTLMHSVRAEAMIVSFNDEGYISRVEMESLLGELLGGEACVLTIANDYKRYVGAKIGIYNPQGEKVGRIGHLTNTEFLYVVARPERIEALQDRLVAREEAA